MSSNLGFNGLFRFGIFYGVWGGVRSRRDIDGV